MGIGLFERGVDTECVNPLSYGLDPSVCGSRVGLSNNYLITGRFMHEHRPTVGVQSHNVYCSIAIRIVIDSC